ncbi:MAG: hypothetical protein LLF76_01240 [Planctomycetaceae bacterium]|nr:hypothetical protein [Planctomycetaceae bacterium]
MTVEYVMERTIAVLLICLVGVSALTMGAALPTNKTPAQQILEEKQASEQTADERSKSAGQTQQAVIEDTTPRFSIQSIELSGNMLISTDVLLSNIPDLYNAQNLAAGETGAVYDFRGIRSIIETGQRQQVSARTIQGFTQYLLWKYQKQGYAGIYVYVPAEAFVAGQDLSQGRLPIHITEAGIASVVGQYYTVNNDPVERGFLRNSALLNWSPVKEGEPVNRKKLDDYLNLMNLNPDRYVSAAVSRGEEPNSLQIRYNVYEACPWHYFVQVDNSGTEDIEWTPRFGIINTNLLGYDDKLTAVYQAVPDSTWNEEYAVFGSYDFPIMGPRLRLNLFAGYNEFDIGDSPLVNFLGRGMFAGGTLRFNLHQYEDWFFDITGSLSYEESKISTLFEDFFNIDTNLHMFMGGYGLEVYRTLDMKETAFSVNYLTLLDGSDEANFTASRGADDDFSLYTTRARHSQYLDASKVHRVSGAVTWITTNDRLVPAKMTTFGGMYTVRGYDESEIIADEGFLASLQYEYDLVRSGQVALFGKETDEDTRKPFLRKLAPLAFIDYGLAQIESPTADETRDRELASVGGGIITELGNNFMGTVYYGYPLIETEDTREGKGRLNVGFLLRW